MSPPTTLVLAADYPPQLGGVAAYSESLVRSLAEAGLPVRVVTSVPGPGGPGVPTDRTPGLFNRKYLKIVPLFAAGLWRCLGRRPPLLVLMKGNHEGVAGLLLHRLTGARYVVVAYGSEIHTFAGHRFAGPPMRHVMKRAERVVAISRYTADLVAGALGVDPGRVAIIPPIVEPPPEADSAAIARVRATYGLKGRRVLLTVARLVKRKGHDVVLRALAGLRERHPDLVYIIAGDGGDRPYVEGLVRDLGLGEIVRMPGAVPPGEIDALYRACDVFVMASRREGVDVEGFGIAFLEAGLRGKPVVAGRCGGVPDAVVDGETGLLVDPLDPDETARAIADLLDDPARARGLGEAARERALREFSRGRQVERLRELGHQLGLFGAREGGAIPALVETA